MQRFPFKYSFCKNSPFVFSSSSFFFDVHVELKRVGVFLRAVAESSLLAFDGRVFNVGMVSLILPGDVQVSRIMKIELLSVPSANMKMEIAILVPFLTNAAFEQLVSSIRACLGLDVFKHDVPWD